MQVGENYKITEIYQKFCHFIFDAGDLIFVVNQNMRSVEIC